MAAVDFYVEQDPMDIVVSQGTVKRLLDQVDAVDDDDDDEEQIALKRAKYTHVYLDDDDGASSTDQCSDDDGGGYDDDDDDDDYDYVDTLETATPQRPMSFPFDEDHREAIDLLSAIYHVGVRRADLRPTTNSVVNGVLQHLSHEERLEDVERDFFKWVQSEHPEQRGHDEAEELCGCNYKKVLSLVKDNAALLKVFMNKEHARDWRRANLISPLADDETADEDEIERADAIPAYAAIFLFWEGLAERLKELSADVQQLFEPFVL